MSPYLSAIVASTSLLCFASARVAFSAPPLAKKTVCTVTLNSADERSLFKDKMGTADFNFVELVDPARPGQWFADACKKADGGALKCDLLVVSGHFGGDVFFGTNRTSGLRWFVRDIEFFACRNKCGGVLSAPIRKFLFGCNTLASKERDNRSPAEYMNALVHAGMSRADAARLVEARYGVFGQSFRDQMQRAFSGAGLLLGFDAKAPAGRAVKPFLAAYFDAVKQKNGNYAKYLASTAPSAPDLEFAKAMAKGGFHHAQAPGLLPSDAKGQKMKAVSCKMRDDAIWYSDRIDLIASLARDPDFFAYIPLAEAFFRMWPPKRLNASTGLLEYEDFRENDALTRLRKAPRPAGFTAALAAQAPSYYKMQLANLGVIAGWITNDAFKAVANETLKKYFKSEKTLPAETIDLICEMGWKVAGALSLAKNDVNASLRANRVFKRVRDCLKLSF